MRFLPPRLLCFLLLLIAPSAFGAFSLDTNSDANSYIVDTGAGLVFKVRKTPNSSSTQSQGDISSLVYNGVQYMDTTKGSQQGSGADFLYHYSTVDSNGVTNNFANTVTMAVTNIGTNFIKITMTCTLNNDPRSGTNDVLTHYYIARAGYPYVYMATIFNVEPDPNQCRFIMRGLPSAIPNCPVPSRNADADSTIESADIFGVTMTNANAAIRGQTRSKHYSNHRQIDWAYTGGFNNQTALAAVWMVKSNHEGDWGGPFYRCLINQNAEIYETLNYNEGNPDEGLQRLNILNGPYTLVFTPGTAPSLPIDTSWLTNSGFNLIGYVPNSQRGRVVGNVSGIPAGFQTVVTFTNAVAQYWCVATNGTFQSPLMIPGNYTQVLMKGELEVATNTAVLVGTNAITTRNIVSQEYKPVALWRIGEWDGSPIGFLNASKAPGGVYPNDLLVDCMHPSDIRLASWTNTATATNPYVIGTSVPSQFPCYQWMGVNGALVIKFNLTPAQALKSRTVRIGITAAFSGARPSVTVNSSNLGFPGPSSQESSRIMTVGTYRGRNTTFTYSCPAGAFVPGTNTMTINLVSGSYAAGQTWLSPSVSYDCIEMD